MWLNPDDNHELLWDYGMCVDTSRGAAVRDLIAKALKGPLVPPQQEVLITDMYLLWYYYQSKIAFITLILNVFVPWKCQILGASIDLF